MIRLASDQSLNLAPQAQSCQQTMETKTREAVKAKPFSGMQQIMDVQIKQHFAQHFLLSERLSDSTSDKDKIEIKVQLKGEKSEVKTAKQHFF